MTIDLVLVGAGALIGMLLGIALQLALGVTKKTMEDLADNRSMNAALLVLLRIVGAGLASVFGVVSALMVLQS